MIVISDTTPINYLVLIAHLLDCDAEIRRQSK